MLRKAPIAASILGLLCFSGGAYTWNFVLSERIAVMRERLELRADTADQPTSQQFPSFPIGYSTSALVHTFESIGWVRLNTPDVRYDWSTVPPDADVFATVHVGMYDWDRNNRSCRAARVRVRDVGTDTVAGESERIPYVPNTNQRQVVRIRLDRRTMLTSYALEVASETKDCQINAQGEIRAEYR